MKNKKPFSPEEFREIYSKATRLCVDLVIKTKGGIILSLRNIPPYRGKWHLPGGTVFFKEKITEAVKRVAMEELGISLKLEPCQLLGYIEYPSEEKNGGFGYTVSLAFLCFSNEINFKSNNEATEVKIFKKLPPGLIKEQHVFLKSIWSELERVWR